MSASRTVLNDTSVVPAVVDLRGGTAAFRRCGTVASLIGAGVCDFRELETPMTVTDRDGQPGMILLFTRRTYAMVTFADIAGDVQGGPQIIIEN